MNIRKLISILLCMSLWGQAFAYAENSIDTISNKNSSIKFYEETDDQSTTGIFIPSGDYLNLSVKDKAVILESCNDENECELERKINIDDINKVVKAYNDDQMWYEPLMWSTVSSTYVFIHVCLRIQKCRIMGPGLLTIASIVYAVGTSLGAQKLILPNTKYEGDLNTLKSKIEKGQNYDYILVEIGGLDEIRLSLSRLAMASNDL